MKKYLLIAVLAVASLAAYAQPRAVGVNLGAWSSISYQHGFGEANMLDVAANVILPINHGAGVGGHLRLDRPVQCSCSLEREGRMALVHGCRWFGWFRVPGQRRRWLVVCRCGWSYWYRV